MTAMKTIEKLTDLRDTEALGKRLANQASPGDVIALTGDLGVGKTALAKAIAEGLGVRETVTSPTFTLLAEYRSGRIPLYHFDVYRAHDADELFEIGFLEYLDGDGLCLVEWADLVEDLLPEDATWIHIGFGSTETERMYTIT